MFLRNELLKGFGNKRQRRLMQREDITPGRALHQINWNPVLGAVYGGHDRQGRTPSEMLPEGQKGQVPVV